MRGKFAQIGRLDRRVVIEQPNRTTNAFGEPINTPTTLTTVWAKRMDERGLERYEQGVLTATRTVDWAIRYLSTVKEDMVLTYDSEDFKIIAIEEIGRKWGLMLKTELKR